MNYIGNSEPTPSLILKTGQKKKKKKGDKDNGLMSNIDLDNVG
jgi:hypothetical protein